MDDAKNLVYGFIIQLPMGEKKSEVRAERPASKSSACSHRGLKVEFDGIAEVIVRFNRVTSIRPQASWPAVLYYPKQETFQWICHEFRSRGTTRLAIVPALNARARTIYSYSIHIRSG
ncbi:hypothetical protein M405DRAFT_818951 [Rhizopogon salebrosus TDB-379]|nr:hypothetical protein M405DRAFT_818951 [Rhizopogon salebrosus TDB-379]